MSSGTASKSTLTKWQLHRICYRLQQFSEDEDYQVIIDKLNNVERDFLELTKVIRGYLFLVNVVMTGTANEFLFLARELNKLVTKKFTITNTAVKETLEATRFGGNFFSAIGIIIAAATALFMFYRIILPINKITQIFKRLSEEKSVLSIPDLYRRDEIGLLARSADVFREKNQQTKELLQNSQDLVAEQEALNSKLVQSSQKLEHATASKSMFLANMSHEIRTPMNGIIGMLDIVLRSKLSDTHRRQLSQAAYSGQILMSVINDILDFTKIEAGKLDVENVNFSLDSLFDNLLANISNRAREKNLSIRFKASPNLPTQLNGDPLRLSQILLNLCSNAIKFTRNGEVSINVDFKAHQDNSKITVYFDITDTGIGMDHEQVGKVFDSFTQADGSTSRKYGGSGLGLSIVKQLVELMNGEISVHSKVNKGSTFSVEVELTKTDDNSEIVAELPAYVGKLFYFVHGSDGFLNKPYIEKMGLNYQLIAIYKLATTLENIGNEDTVLLDISNQDTFINYQNEINKVLEKSISIGFVTQSQPSNLANQLSAKWQIDCLSHPFTPKQASIYLKSLISNKSNADILVEPTAEFQSKTQYEGHVLLVEDNNINQVIAGEMLKLLGVTFDVAEDGQQAVTKIVNSSHYDLVLMDIQMPVMDGYEATVELRKQGYHSLAICGLSANAMKQDHDKALEMGMNDYIVKPVKHEAIERVVAKYLTVKAPSIT